MVTESEHAFRAILSWNLSVLRPELALRCEGLSVDRTIEELRKWAGREVTYARTHSTATNSTKTSKLCNFCHAKGHLDTECRKKSGVKCDKCSMLGHTAATCRKVGRIAATSSEPAAVQSFQLDTAADETSTGDRNLFSSYSPCNLSVTLANASKGRILGKGTIAVPASPQPISIPAVHLEGCNKTLLSLASLEKAGYHLHVPEDINVNLQLRDKARHSHLTFQRRGPRYIWEPPQPPSSWHAALGHVNDNFMARTLRQHNIDPPAPTDCTPCAKAKFTRQPGHARLLNATAKLQVIHLDLVGGKDALPPTTGVSDVPAAQLCLLLIDEHTRFKWQIPVYHKDDCPQLLKAFLLKLNTSYNRFPARLHSDRDSEFINGRIQDFLTEHGIHWTEVQHMHTNKTD